jgi:hypothetical protein
MDGSRPLTLGLTLVLVVGGALSCRGTPQPVTRTDAARSASNPQQPPAATPPSVSETPAPPPAEEKRKGDAAPVVVDAGVDDSQIPKTLVEAAHAERARRAGAEKSSVVINDKTLPRYAAKGQITVADPKAKDRAKGASPALAAAAAQARDEQYWRGRARQLRETWKQAADEVKELEQKSGELRLKFYAESDSFLRDTQVKPEWDRVLDHLRQAKLDVDAAKQDLAKFLEEGRAANALPGWLDEGIENEPEEPKKIDKDGAPVQSIEPPVLDSDKARTPPPGTGR